MKMHHDESVMRDPESKCLIMMTYCGKRFISDPVSDEEWNAELAKPKAEVDLSPAAVAERGHNNHCEKCLRYKTRRYGRNRMRELGYPIKNYRGTRP